MGTTRDGRGKWYCDKCHMLAVAPHGLGPTEIRARLSALPECGSIAPGSLAKQTWRYATAVTRWIAAGRPRRSPQQVHRLLEQFCHRCDAYRADRQACGECGCKVSAAATPLLNKLAMATEGCPRGRFSAEHRPSDQ